MAPLRRATAWRGSRRSGPGATTSFFTAFLEVEKALAGHASVIGEAQAGSVWRRAVRAASVYNVPKVVLNKLSRYRFYSHR
jgi:hypothetical protein